MLHLKNTTRYISTLLILHKDILTWANVDPDLNRYMASIGHNELISEMNFPILLSPYHGCWWPGHTRSQSISNYGTDLVRKRYFIAHKGIFQLSNDVQDFPWICSSERCAAICFSAISLSSFWYILCSRSVSCCRRNTGMKLTLVMLNLF